MDVNEIRELKTKLKEESKLDLTDSEKSLEDFLAWFAGKPEVHSLHLVENQFAINWVGLVNDGRPGIITWLFRSPTKISEMITEILDDERAFTKVYLITDIGKSFVWQGDATEFYKNFFQVKEVINTYSGNN